MLSTNEYVIGDIADNLIMVCLTSENEKVVDEFVVTDWTFAGFGKISDDDRYTYAFSQFLCI